MPLAFGGNTVNKLYFGETEVKKMYLGDALAYEAGDGDLRVTLRIGTQSALGSNLVQYNNVTGIPIPEEFIDPNIILLTLLTTVYLKRFTMNSSGDMILNISSTDGGNSSGLDLIESWETNTEGLILGVADDSNVDDLVLPGPNAAGNERQDDAAPYSWSTPTSHRNAIRTFFTQFNNSSHRDSTFLTLVASSS